MKCSVGLLPPGAVDALPVGGCGGWQSGYRMGAGGGGAGAMRRALWRLLTGGGGGGCGSMTCSGKRTLSVERAVMWKTNETD